MSEVFDHVLEDKDNAEIDTTIVLSNTDTRYLYNISDEDKGDNEEKNEIPLLKKPDDNLMSNEIISFVPTGYEIEIETKDGNKDESEMSNEIISFIPVEENDVHVSTLATLNVTEISKKTTSDELKNETVEKKDDDEKDKTKIEGHKKRHRKDKSFEKSMDDKLPISLGVRSKPSSARKRLQRGRGFRNTKGYHSSSGPMDFLKKRYKSEYLEVSTTHSYDNVIFLHT